MPDVIGPKYSKVMKSKDLQPKLLYPTKLSFRIERQIKSFPDKKMLRVYHHQTSITRSVKGSCLRKRKNFQNMNDKMAINKYVSRITLIPRYLSASGLITAHIHCILMRKNISALGTCSGLIALARTRMRHDATLQEKMLHHLLLACHLVPLSHHETEVDTSVSW